MTTWMKENWRWALLNVVALIILLNLLRQAYKVGDLTTDVEPLVETGKWAVRFLLLSLLMTPLNTLFGWRSAIKLRKPAGLWAFAFGFTHFALYVFDSGSFYLQYPIPDYYAGLGVIALVILSLLAVTSTRWAMKRMGKWWKRLHRLVYAAAIIGLVHGLLESVSSKRVMAVDALAVYEVGLYLALLTLLLAVRIPAVRSALVQQRHRLFASRS